MKIYFIAGETSGDNHGAALMQALRRFQPDIKLLGRGGLQMKQIAGERLLDWSDQAGIVGLWEVVNHYGYFRREFEKTLNEIAAAKPDAVVLIDYPGFNLQLARTLRSRSLGGKIIYYISPQVWAWNRARIPQMARSLDLMLCIFPFEAELYGKSGPTDELSVIEQLKTHGDLEKAGDRHYVSELAASVAAVSNADHHARIVQEN